MGSWCHHLLRCLAAKHRLLKAQHFPQKTKKKLFSESNETPAHAVRKLRTNNNKGDTSATNVRLATAPSVWELVQKWETRSCCHATILSLSLSLSLSFGEQRCNDAGVGEWETQFNTHETSTMDAATINFQGGKWKTNSIRNLFSFFVCFVCLVLGQGFFTECGACSMQCSAVGEGLAGWMFSTNPTCWR